MPRNQALACLLLSIKVVVMQLHPCCCRIKNRSSRNVCCGYELLPSRCLVSSSGSSKSDPSIMKSSSSQLLPSLRALHSFVAHYCELTNSPPSSIPSPLNRPPSPILGLSPPTPGGRSASKLSLLLVASLTVKGVFPFIAPGVLQAACAGLGVTFR